MSLRRAAPLALGLWVLACQPSHDTPNGGPVPPPTQVNTPAFELDPAQPLRSVIPLPNDLALQAFGAPVSAPASALDEFKNLLLNDPPAGYRGFPPDQSGATITFTSVRLEPGAETPVAGPAPDLDLHTLGPSSVAIVRLDTGDVLQVDPTASSYAIDPASPNVGTLTLVPVAEATSGSRRWPAGAPLVIALRGGASGVKTKAGDPIGTSRTLQLLLSPTALTDPSIADSLIVQQVLAQGGLAGLQQLEALRQTYATPRTWGRCPLPTCPRPVSGAPGYPQGTWVPLPGQGGTLSALAAIDKVFPHNELASLQTFTVGTLSGTWVDVDPAAGRVPLPSDFIGLPGLLYSNGTPTPTGKAFGALAPGLAKLDGFSTTGMLLAPVSGLVDATSANLSPGVLVFEVPDEGSAIPLHDVAAAGPAAQYLVEPPPITVDTVTHAPCAPPYPSTCTVAPVIGLQPAVAVPLPAPFSRTVALPPLKEATRYAVVVTSSVKDAAAHDLVRGTLARILFDFTHPLVVDGKSALPIFTDAQALGFQSMRQLLAARVIPSVPGGQDSVAMAYTFKTQSITGQALQLAALPGTVAGLPDAPTAATRLTVAAAGQKYGLPTGAGQPLDPAAVSSVIEATMVTVDLLDPATGAFRTDEAPPAPLPISALVVIPQPVPQSAAPLVVFRHGLNRGRADVLLLATALAKGGMVAAAIDGDKFGDRAWCQTNADCATGACVADPALVNQGDAPATPTPGSCKLANGSAGQLAYRPVVPTCTQASGCWNGTGGLSMASGNYFVSANFFRTRDSIRQGILDQSVLARALTSTAGQDVLRAAIGSTTFALDPSQVSFVGQSLGAMEGTIDVAVNPLFSKAVLNAGGGTAADIFTTSPAFRTGTGQLLAGLGIQPGTAAYLQFLHVAKWVLDPADPVNFASHLIADPLPNPLAPGTTQAPKAILGQAARCDSVIPNAANQLLYGLIGLSPLDPTGGPGTPPLQWFMADTTTSCPADGSTGAGGAAHGFLLDPTQNATLTSQAQGDVVRFLLTDSVEHPTPVTP